MLSDEAKNWGKQVVKAHVGDVEFHLRLTTLFLAHFVSLQLGLKEAQGMKL